MTAKKKTKQKQKKVKRATSNKATLTRKTAAKKLALKTSTPKKKLSKKKATERKADANKKAVGNKPVAARTPSVLSKRVLEESRIVDTAPFPPRGRAARSGQQSGDLQGLSSVKGADSESVDELLEEGNAFEAEAVTGVEDAENTDEKEVRTHEVPEDDVPEEYLDKD
jgi:N utilization substance protein A